MSSRLPKSRYDLSQTDLESVLVGEPAYRVNQVWDGLYKRAQLPAEMSEVPAELRVRLDEQLPVALTLHSQVGGDGGDTVKSLWQMRDGNRVETVLMRYRDRVTACVSSQAGCGMGCVFCATGQMGLKRNLGVGEILEQVVHARREASPRRLGNLVFMGMGEPMANYDNVWAAIERIHDEMGISARRITVSTVGIVPGIRRIAGESLPVNLAVSLHAANDELRTRLVPLGQRYPLAELYDACREYIARTGRRLSFEWALINGINDRSCDARELAAAARALNAHVNLIPLNSTAGYQMPGTPSEGVRSFCSHLIRLGVNATVRDNKGTQIQAACGQLAASELSLPVVTTGD